MHSVQRAGSKLPDRGVLTELWIVRAGLGFCQDLNLLSTDPADIVQTCNTIYGLLLQHQKDSRFKEQLKTGLKDSLRKTA
jgi:hypothetical protein